MAADMEGWRGNFGNEIIKQWIVHERDIFLGNSGHILGYAKLGYEKAIRSKWPGQNTVFPFFNHMTVNTCHSDWKKKRNPQKARVSAPKS